MKKKQQNNLKEKLPKNKVLVDGTVLEALPNAMFKVMLDNNSVVLCTVSGNMRRHLIRVLPCDRVQIGVETYDLSRGIIYYRYDNSKKI